MVTQLVLTTTSLLYCNTSYNLFHSTIHTRNFVHLSVFDLAFTLGQMSQEQLGVRCLARGYAGMPGIEPPTLQVMDALLYFLIFSRFSFQ